MRVFKTKDTGIKDIVRDVDDEIIQRLIQNVFEFYRIQTTSSFNFRE